MKRAVPIALLLLAACQMTTAQPASPAVLTNPGADVQQELAQAIADLSGFASVRLSDADLTRSSELLVERTPQRSLQGEGLQGRDLELPQRFRLLTWNGQCWLLHVASGRQQPLKRAQCREQRQTP
jgi:hypothetical protein